MKPVVEATGGMVVQTDTFLNPVFKESFKRVFALEAEEGYLAVASNATFEVPPAPARPSPTPPPPLRCATAPPGRQGRGRRRASVGGPPCFAAPAGRASRSADCVAASRPAPLCCESAGARPGKRSAPVSLTAARRARRRQPGAGRPAPAAPDLNPNLMRAGHTLPRRQGGGPAGAGRAHGEEGRRRGGAGGRHGRHHALAPRRPGAPYCRPLALLPGLLEAPIRDAAAADTAERAAPASLAGRPACRRVHAMSCGVPTGTGAARSLSAV